MSKPSMPNIPGMGAMTETFDFVKNLWGGMGMPGMNIPGMVMPSLSVEEINKQISDLKAVESWLTLNMSMLRSTIQALEVQSATISTLQSMSDTLSAAMKPGADKAAPVEKKSAPSGATAAAEEPPAQAKTARAAKAGAKTASDGAAALGDPTAWWNMLQDQFKQAVNTALATEETKPAAKASAGPKPGAKKAAPRKSPTRRKSAPK